MKKRVSRRRCYPFQQSSFTYLNRSKPIVDFPEILNLYILTFY